MQFFTLSFDKIVLRYFLMMAVVIGSIFAGQPLFAILALPIFMSAVLGVSFGPAKAVATKKKGLQIVQTTAKPTEQQNIAA